MIKSLPKLLTAFIHLLFSKKSLITAVWQGRIYVPCCANQMSGFYMTRNTVLKNELKIEYTYFTCDLKVSWFRPVSICWRTCHSGDQHTICRRPNIETKTIYYHTQPSVAFHIEASHLICNAKQMASFYIKCNNELKWGYVHSGHQTEHYVILKTSIFLEKSCTKCGGDASPGLKNRNLAYLYINSLTKFI